MDPVLPAEVEDKAGKDNRRSIQFSVPSAVPTQLDPQQVEMIRRRRPTPATLFRLTDHPSPEEDHTSHQWGVGELSVLKNMRVTTSVYQPPSLKGAAVSFRSSGSSRIIELVTQLQRRQTAVQRLAQVHMQSLATRGSVDREDRHSSGEEDSEDLSPASDSQEDIQLGDVGERPEMLVGSEVNSKGRPDHFSPVIRPRQPRDPHGDEAEEEEEEEEEDQQEGRGE